MADNRMVNRVQIPYIDFGRSSHVPDEMRKHIDRTTMIALCPTVRLFYLGWDWA